MKNVLSSDSLSTCAAPDFLRLCYGYLMTMNTPRPTNFRVKLYISENRVDFLFGTIGKTHDVYLATSDVGHILKKPNVPKWSLNFMNGTYEEIAFQTDPCKKDFGLITRCLLLQQLKLDVIRSKEVRYLCQLLGGRKNVRDEGIQYDEYVLNSCSCAAFNGRSFIQWARRLKNQLFCSDLASNPCLSQSTAMDLASNPCLSQSTAMDLDTNPCLSENTAVNLTSNPCLSENTTMDIDYPADFRMRIHFVDTALIPFNALFGTIGKDDALYLSAFDVARILQKRTPFKWANQHMTGKYNDIASKPIEKKNHYYMIQKEPLLDLLKAEEEFKERATYLRDLLEGNKNIREEGIKHGEHIMNSCPCAQFHGIAFKTWIQKHTIQIFLNNYTPISPQ